MHVEHYSGIASNAIILASLPLGSSVRDDPIASHEIVVAGRGQNRAPMPFTGEDLDHCEAEPRELRAKAVANSRTYAFSG